MNCPNCPAPLICPEGGIAYCTDCGWGTVEWWAKKYSELNVRLGELQGQVNAALDEEETVRKLQKRRGELIDAILTHRRDTPPGASDVDRTLWATVVDPVPYGLESGDG